jgi:hypothetical protein
MKKSIRKIFKIFKYLVILFTLGYWIYIVIDDYVFIENYWSTNWLEYIGLWTVYYLIYLLVFSLYFWAISFIGILIYHKLIKRKTTADN